MKQASKLPVKWMAPESLQFGTYSTATDVWSFGVTLWEVFTFALRPYHNIPSSELINRLVNQDYRLERPTHCPPKIYETMHDCWELEPAHRPAFAALERRLAGLVQDPDLESIYEAPVRLNQDYYSLVLDQASSTEPEPPALRASSIYQAPAAQRRVASAAAPSSMAYEVPLDPADSIYSTAPGTAAGQALYTTVLTSVSV